MSAPKTTVAGGDSRRLQPVGVASGSSRAMEHWDEIRRLDLVEHIAELDAVGLTVVPPEKVAPPAFVERLLDAVLRVAHDRSGDLPDLDGTHDAAYARDFGRQFFFLLFEDDVFQEAVLNPTALALATYLLGESCVLSNCLAGLKGPGGPPLTLHSDNVMIPPPFPPYAQVCNVTWALTDYGPGSGQLQFVPGSHRFGRHPAPDEGLDVLEPVSARAGSIIFWHGNTWHGALPRTEPGLRINLIVAMMRPYLRPQEAYREHVTDELVARNPRRFATLVGLDHNYGWTTEGPQPLPDGVQLPGRGHVYD